METPENIRTLNRCVPFFVNRCVPFSAISALKTTAFLLVLLLLGGCQSTQVKAQNERLATAQAIFDERCKKAGVTIHRTVDDVEGIFLMKVRPEGINYGNQFKLDDPYGSDLGGDGYIMSFTRGSFQANTSGTPAKGSPPRLGYPYVEAIDPEDGKRYRYTGSVKDVVKTSSIIGGGDGRTKFTIREFTLDRVPATGEKPRYGLTYKDISTHKDREYWIAGSSLRVIDLKINEVIAERIGYMMDYGQGSRAGGRAPWLFAADNACPNFQRNPFLPPRRGATAQARQAQDFVESVVKPTRKGDASIFPREKRGRIYFPPDNI